jgi:hypothetical protein
LTGTEIDGSKTYARLEDRRDVGKCNDHNKVRLTFVRAFDTFPGTLFIGTIDGKARPDRQQGRFDLAQARQLRDAIDQFISDQSDAS